MRSRGVWWLIFGGCAVAVVAALSWVSVEMVRLERAELSARADATHQESLRLALWRMDSWLAPQLARESARPYFEYLPYYPHERAYTRLLYTIESNEVYTESPLLRYESALFLLHFQMDDEGAVTSPQVPVGNLRDLAEANDVSGARVREMERRLAQLRAILGERTNLATAVALAEEDIKARLGEAAPPAPSVRLLANRADTLQKTKQLEWSKAEQGRRAQTSYQSAQSFQNVPMKGSQGGVPRDGADDQAAASRGSGADGRQWVEVGPLVPVWLDDLDIACVDPNDEQASCVMVLVRRVAVGADTYLQGLMLDWRILRRSLLERVGDLFPAGELRVLRNQAQADAAAGQALATIPVALLAAAPSLAVPGGLTTTQGTLILVWVAVLIAVSAVGVTLRASIAYGEKRSRFAAAVTHELRTPLTTFRMYSEMLAEGMVQDDEQRQTYLTILRKESNRLATLVENVLAYARLERGHLKIEPKEIGLGRLLEELTPPLRRRAEDADMDLQVTLQAEPESTVFLDVSAVAQILFNLVDNACKYASAAKDRILHLVASIEDGQLMVEVRDHGPGIAPQHAHAVFVPFERGSRQPGDTTPGVGLGLALSRGLARSLGGDLRLDGRESGGACFRLTLPTGR